MSETTTPQGGQLPPGLAALEALIALETETVRLADEISASVRSFLDGLRVVAAEATGGQAVSLLLLQIGQIAMTGARLGVHRDFAPRDEYQPDDGPDPDLDGLRLQLATLLGDLDTYSYVFDPYDPEIVEGLLSDDLTSIAADLAVGVRHHDAGDVEEALWWWQFSYVSSWGALAGSAMKALLSVVAHDRLDVDLDTTQELELVQVAAAALDSGEKG
ncbi:DUF5063 domain-containing protein [Pimelobacter simplex]|uniref:DUF5063 domain-containing protein n=2 Tax=Nocardioides simplex TaxID=2045 RepID=A0A0A1DQH5_NOCSI|nr:DUF5063 domain-containing protein [Pimelobacter simplex]AIY19671.2 hypothetical protein KR76_02770 [Pimelobacter simplex]KAB2807867.1 DUF5063 domain-containing protein [Pimelobacter simplex]GEB12448.1 DUF5063 domain-containing protein [Pimelobacter simplex]SFM94909.1 protein of unknown function [Pimelobacter simplex]